MGRSGARLVALAVTVVLLASGCWAQIGAGPGQRFHNPWETVLTPERVADLEPAWSADGRALVTFGNSVVLADGRTLRAVSPVDGSELWSVALPTGNPSLATRIDSVVTVGAQLWVTWSAPDCLAGYARLHAGTGVQIHADAAAVGTMRYRTASDEGVVLDISGCTTPGATGVLDPSGTPRFEIPRVVDLPNWIEAHPAQGGGRLFDNSGNTIRAFDLDGCGAPQCEPVWTTELVAEAGAWQLAVSADGASLYAGTTTIPATVLRFDAATGAQLGRMVLAGSQLGTLAIADGMVFAASGQVVEAFDTGCTGDCEPVWTGALPSWADAPMAIGAGVVHVSSGGAVVSFATGGCGAATCDPIGTTDVDAENVLVASGLLITTGWDGTTAYRSG